MKRLTRKRIDRYDELFEQAINRYLDKTDFDVYDWIYEDEKQEFEELAILCNKEITK